MAAIENLEWIDLADFTPGIYQRYITTGPAPDGAAQADGTYRCYADPHGGLFPLFHGTAMSAAGSGSPWSGAQDIATLATQVVSPVMTTTTYALSHELFAVFNFDAGGSDRYYSFYNLTTNTQLSSVTDNTGDPNHRGYASLDLTRVNADDPTLPGHCIVAGRMGSDRTDSEGFYFPEFTDAVGGAAQLHSFGNSDSQFYMTHQGRLVAASNRSILGKTDFINQNRRIPGSEELHYWDVRNPDVGFFEAGLQVVEENPSGFASWVSMNANELFLVKQRGGGVLIRGDLARPQIIRLPGVASCWGAACLGAVTPLGYLYGTRNGVWAWNGSDTCESVSDNLDSNFWICDGLDLWLTGQPLSKFGYCHPWVFVGNSWVLDVRTGAWWRLEDPESHAFHNYEIGANGRVYAFYPMRDSAAQSLGRQYDIFSSSSRARSFQWTSQPLARSRNRRLDFRQVSMVLQGVGTVTVTVTGLNGATSQASKTINSPNRPVTIAQPINVHAHDAVVTIESDSGGSQPAPTVYRVSLGFRQNTDVGS